MTTLRYTGTVPTNFAVRRLGDVQPGETFGVPDDEADAYLSRADIELSGPEPETSAEGESTAETETSATAETA
jgi:hypothetical protein